MARRVVSKKPKHSGAKVFRRGNRLAWPSPAERKQQAAALAEHLRDPGAVYAGDPKYQFTSDRSTT